MVTVHAAAPTLDRFPPELFFDDDLVWHRQQVGMPGLVALGGALVRGGELIHLGFVSDVFQRRSRAPAHSSQIRKRLGGWPNITLHALAHLGRRLGLRTLRSPRSRLVLTVTDPGRDPGAELFEWAYDRTLSRDFGAVADGDWWRIDLDALAPLLVPMTAADEPFSGDDRPTVCLVHDIERGIGHVATDPGFARQVESRGWSPLDRMLEVEGEAGVSATYSVVGTLWNQVYDRISNAGHEVAFHSFDHGPGRQLLRCRQVDYRARGYRPPQSRLGWEHRAPSMIARNFDWLASSAHSLGIQQPEIRRRLVRIPIAMDDFPLHTGAMDYAGWQAQLLETIDEQAFTAVGLHDCYGDRWLDRYPDLLEHLKRRARIIRLGDVADELVRAGGE
jgi:hypothetical protein